MGYWYRMVSGMVLIGPSPSLSLGGGRGTKCDGFDLEQHVWSLEAADEGGGSRRQRPREVFGVFLVHGVGIDALLHEDGQLDRVGQAGASRLEDLVQVTQSPVGLLADVA